jgi:uncharacterized protein (AIM24 family)
VRVVGTAREREAFEQAIVRGSELLRQNQLDQAQRAFRAALDIEPGSPKVLALLGLTHFRAGEFAEARPIYEQLVERTPTDASHRLNLGLVYLKLNDSDRAIGALEASRALDPSQGRAVSYLGLAYARAGRYAEAYRSFLLAGQNDLAVEIEQNLTPAERDGIHAQLQRTPSGPLPVSPPASPPEPAAEVRTATPPRITPEAPRGGTLAAAFRSRRPGSEPSAEPAVARTVTPPSGLPDTPPGATRPATPPTGVPRTAPPTPPPKPTTPTTGVPIPPWPDSEVGPRPHPLGTGDVPGFSQPVASELRTAVPEAVEILPRSRPATSPPRRTTGELPAIEIEAELPSGNSGQIRAILAEEPAPNEPARITESMQFVLGAKPAAPQPIAGETMISRAVADAEPAAGAVSIARAAEGAIAPRPLSELATDELIRTDDGDAPFEVSAGGALIIRVKERMLTRLDGVHITGGDLAYEPATRRSRGHQTDERFDHGGVPLHVVTGTGYLIAIPRDNKFHAVALDDDIFYLREDLVFAFEPSLRWENGNVPGLRGRLPVVQFRGDGAVALALPRPLVRVKLPPQGVVFVDANRLAGWIGRVIPRAVVPPRGGPLADVCVECTGEGVVLIDSDPAKPVVAPARTKPVSIPPPTATSEPDIDLQREMSFADDDL